MGNKISQYNIPVEDTVVQEGGTCSFRSRYLDDINGPFDFTSGFTDLKTALIQSFTMNKDKLSVGAVINTQPKETDCDSSGMKENVLEYEYITYGELHQKVHQLAKSLHSLEL